VNFSFIISFTLREGYRSRVFENTVLRIIFGLMAMEEAKGWRRMHNEELCNITMK
jgi:hypothetical protein